MAKCVGSTTSWRPTLGEPDDLSFLIDDVRLGEELLRKRLESKTSNQITSIARDFLLIQQATISDIDKYDSNQVQESINSKLQDLYSQTSSVIQKVCSPSTKIIAASKHRYFINISTDTIDKLKQLLQTTGRLSDLDPELYTEERLKPLISEESTTIHTLTSIWLAAVEIMNSLRSSAIELFKNHPSLSNPCESSSPLLDYNFFEHLEFSSSGPQFARVFLMDLISTSWIQFNRLVKFDDLVRCLPFLCPCHCKIFLRVLQLAHPKESSDSIHGILSELLALVLDPRSKPHMVTESLRNYEIVPLDPPYSGADRHDLGYFLVWHLYALSKIMGNEQRLYVSNCSRLLSDGLKLTMDQFLSSLNDPTADRLSPHQEERLQLLLFMVNHWCEHNDKDSCIGPLAKLFGMLDSKWKPIGEAYFERSEFRINGLTIFQLFNKLANEIIPMRSSDGGASAVDSMSQDEKNLRQTWDKLLARVQPKAKPLQPVEKVAETTREAPEEPVQQRSLRARARNSKQI